MKAGILIRAIEETILGIRIVGSKKCGLIWAREEMAFKCWKIGQINRPAIRKT